MNVVSGIKETIQASLFRIKSVGTYMNFISEYLRDLTQGDEKTERLLAEIRGQSEALSRNVQTLAQDFCGGETAPVMLTHNRRREDRFVVEGEVTVVIREWMQPCILKNLSRGGLSLMGRFPLHERAFVDLVVSSPFFPNTVYKNVRVAWFNKVHHNLWEGGLEFKTSKGLIN